jgi:hypothetical protein
MSQTTSYNVIVIYSMIGVPYKTVVLSIEHHTTGDHAHVRKYNNGMACENLPGAEAF